MSETPWTPGPWELDERVGCVAVYPSGARPHCLAGAETTAIHYTSGYKELAPGGEFERWVVPEETVANARLIAAAPELVAALEAIYATAIEPDATFSEGAFRDAILNSRALLARIKGESNE